MLGVFLILSILTVVKPQIATAAAPSNLNFQARLQTASGAIVPDGNYNVEFKLYNTSTVTPTPDQGACTRNGGTAEATCLWVETRTGANVVTVKNGYLTVNLGSVTAFGGSIDWSQQMWLTMRIGGTGTPSWDAEMSPRLQLTATPYAMYAANAALLGGLSSSQFIQNTTSTQASSNFNISGTGTAGTSIVTPLLDTASSVALNIGATSSVINLNQSTTLAAGKSLTFTAGTGTITQTLNTTSATSGYTLNLTNGSGVQTNGISIVRNAASGTTTNGINVTSTAGTLTNGLAITTNGGTIGTGLNITNTSGTLTTGISLTGTFASNLINSTNFSVSNTGIITTANLGTSTGAVAICRNSSNQISSCGINSAGVTLQNAYDASTNPEFVLNSTNGALTVRDNATPITGNLFEVQNNAGGSTFFGVTATATSVGGNLNVAANGSVLLAAGTGTITQTLNTTSATSGYTLNLTNGSGVQTDGIYINRNAASGTTTNGVNVTSSAGTLTNGLALTTNGGTIGTGVNITNTTGTLTTGVSFTGTIGTDINRGSGTLSINGGGGINLQTGATTTASLSGTGAASFQNSTDSANGFQVKQSSGAGGAAVVNVDTSGSNIQLLGNNAATLSTWTQTTAMTVGSAGAGQQRVRGGAVAANGYLYQVGGNDGAGTALTTVQYAKINADGTVGTWTSTSALPSARRQAQPVVANGYIYLIGGRDSGGSATATSYYAKINNDGTLGTWNTTTALTSGAGARFAHGTVVYNGYIWSIGGLDGTLASTNGVYYNKINPDGSLGASWTSTGANLPANLSSLNSAVVANGYVYLAGGYDSSVGDVDKIYYAKLNTDGTTSSWTTQSSMLPAINENPGVYVANGYLYVVGGDSGGTVSAFPLSATGGVGSRVTLTALPFSPGGEASFAQANSYFYLIGGSSGADGGGTARNTVYYTSTPRVQVGGGLDLVGYSGENLNEGGSGGTLTAGNTAIIGTLQVQDSANFARAISVNGDLTVAGNGVIKSATNATNAFQVQNASGNEIITVDTSGSQVTFGKASTINAKMAFYNSSNANTVTIQSGVTSGSYSLTLPTAIASTGQCLAAGTVSGGNVPLTFTTCGAGGGGVTTIGTIDSQTKSADGAVISGSNLYLQTADTGNPGLVSTGIQTFAGAKTFNGDVTIAANQNLTLSAGTGTVSQTYNSTSAGTAETINVTNTSGNNTNGLLINRNGASGITDNGINITQTAGTLTNGLVFNGTIGTDINRTSGTLSLNGAGGVNLKTNGSTTASLSSTGAATFQNGTDSATGFQVKQSSGAGGATVLDVDTSNGRVGIGTAAPAATFHTAVNNSQVLTPAALLEQTGTGDTTLEFRNATTSFYAGVDASNSNSFAINSKTGATTPITSTITRIQQAANLGGGNGTNITQAYSSNVTAGNMLVVVVNSDVGTTHTCSDSLGNTWTNALQYNNGYIETICYAVASSSGADTVTATFSASVGFRRLAVTEYSGIDTTTPVNITASGAGTSVSGVPDSVTSPSATTTNPKTLIFGVAFNKQTTTTFTPGTGFTQIASLNDRLIVQEKIQTAAGSVQNLNSATTNDNYNSLFVAFNPAVTSGTLTDTYSGSLFTLSGSGAAKLQNTSDSSTALLVNNAAGAGIFTVDTATSAIRVGSSTTDAVATLLVLDSYSTSTDPTGVAGAMYYSTASNTFRCYENGGWKDCLSHHVITLGSDVADSSGNCTFADVTGLSFAVSSGSNYRFHANIVYISAATTTGLGLGINGPASPTLVSYLSQLPVTAGATPLNTNLGAGIATAYDGGGCSATTPSTATTGWAATLDGLVRPSASGTATLRFASEVNGSAVTIKAGSTLEWW